MAREYDYWIDKAKTYKDSLQNAIVYNQEKNILYYRGKYIYALKQAYKLNPNGLVPSSITVTPRDIPLPLEIKVSLADHQDFISKAIKNARKDVDIKKPVLAKELGLKINRLSTRVDQANFATGTVQKKDFVNDSLGLAGTVIKAPIMISAKIVSKVGPLAITIMALPFTVFAALMSFVFNPSNDYNNTGIHQISKELKKAVKEVSTSIYETTGRL